MRKFYFLLSFLTICLLGCTSNGVDNEGFALLNKHGKVFYASIEADSTRVYYDGNHTLWTAEDQISIFNGSTQNKKYTFIGETGVSSGSFIEADNQTTGTSVTLATNYAVYPYNASTSISVDGIITLTLPAIQPYANGSYGLGSNTMVAVTKDVNDDKLQFKNLCGYLVVSLYGGETVKSVTFTGNNGEKIAGAATVIATNGTAPTVTMSETATNSITIDCGDGVTLGTTAEEATEFWFVLPPTTFEKGFTITASDADKVLFEKTTDISRDFQRNIVNSMAALKIATISVPEVVDLGLSVKWASFNLGASHPEDYGDFYAWGEVETYYSSINPLVWKEGKEGYSWSSYKWCNGSNSTFTKYNNSVGYGIVDNKTVLEAEDDVAHAALGSNWRMPTIEEWEELLDNCSWTWTTQNGVYGRKVKSNISGYTKNWIFLPAAGCIPAPVGSQGYYWSSSLASAGRIGQALSVQFDSSTNGYYRNTNLRYGGYSIRPVKTTSDNPYPVKGVTLDKSSLHFSTNNSSQKLNAGIWPSNAADKSVIWSSSDASVATVAQDGRVTSVGTGSAIITVKTNDGGYTATCSVTVGLPASTPDAIDLGLSVKWASYNLGATKPEEFGDYYSWGELEPHYISQDPLLWKDGMNQGYSWSTYKWCNGSATTLTKYNTKSGWGIIDNKIMLDPEDDAAYKEYGGEWRVPTKEEWEELITKCRRTANNENGVNGWQFTGPNGNSIFIPFAGYWSGNRLFDTTAFMNVWSSSLCEDDPQRAWRVRFSAGSGTLATDKCNRQIGQSIRPVYGRPVTAITLDKNEMVITELNHSLQLTATITPSNATNKRVIWTSSNTDIATVSQDGTVTAVGYGTATITAATEDGGFTATCTVMITAIPEAIDLGLSVKWASCNLGAIKPEEYGDYFAWGEILTKPNYLWTNYKWCNGSSTTLTKYCSNSANGYNGFTDSKTCLDPEDDVVRFSLGGSWRMPTDAEWNELLTQCTWVWATMNGVNGRLVTGPNGNSIFLPAAGYISDVLYSVESRGSYWSTGLDTDKPNRAVRLAFSSEELNIDLYARYVGRSIRPVCD